MTAFSHVLFATDLDVTSSEAGVFASQLARKSGATLTLVHVCEPPRALRRAAPRAGAASPASLVRATQRALDAAVAAMRATVPTATGILHAGEPSAVILATARALGADVIVLGTHGRHGVARMMGSVAEKVVRLSPVPVFTVRPGPSPRGSLAGAPPAPAPAS